VVRIHWAVWTGSEQELSVVHVDGPSGQVSNTNFL